MGGEWWFSFENGTSKINVEEYQRLLIEIREAFRELIPDGKEKNDVEVFWWEENDCPSGKAPQDNIFAKFTYRNSKSNNAQGYWILYWNPNIVKVEDRWSSMRARNAPYSFTNTSVKIQYDLAFKFPQHFQLYLGDGTSSVGPQCNQYFGVIPVNYSGGYDGMAESEEDDPELR